MSNTELYDVLEEMVEHTSVTTILEETVKHVDQHLFANHFLTRET